MSAMSATDLDTLMGEARRSVRQQDYRRAAELFRKVLDGDETHVAACEGLASACFLGGEYREAAAHFERLTKLNPRHPRAFVNLGAVYNRLQEYDKAVQALRRGVQIDRKCATGFYNLGIAQRHIGQLNLAVSAYQEAIRLQPQMAEACQNLANVYLEMGNYRQAISFYEKALALNPGFERAQHGLAAARQARDEAKRAISPFGRLVDEKTISDSANVPPAARRELTNLERIEDRKALAALALQIEEVTRDMAHQIKEVLIRDLLDLNLAVAESEKNSVVAEANETFREAVDAFENRRRLMQQALDKLRAHEAQMEAPQPAGSSR